MGIVIKNTLELQKMQESGRIVAGVLDAVEVACVPGVTTAELERIARRELTRAKASSAFLGYRQGGSPPFPAVLCTSVNQVVVHGIPSERTVLGEGDVIGIDFACFKNGYCGDAARTVAVGVVSEPARDLIVATRAALEAAIAECVPGNRLGDVGAAVEALAARRGYSIVREFVGHGIGRAMHEAPQVPNYGNRGAGLRLKAGMVIAIEPMLNAGRGDVRVLADGWTVETRDLRLSAHVEHTVAITSDGPRVLTA
ncbi:MAG TPA: type I methionyl aminopeptidase [Polyangiaceae bacterium]|nr:type I methionyl aminopeptidase [Polyangiaceae bacterium]